MDGARACPLEDCGGPPGYEDLVRALKDKWPSEDERAQLVEWAGDYDPEEFDLNAVNRLLKKSFRK